MSTKADIAIYGGAAGGGKSFGLLLEPLRHFHNSKFGGVIFRRTTNQIRNEGGLWDNAMNLYAPLGATMNSSSLECIFPSGMKMKFAHLEHEKNMYDWQGSQIAFIGFDELTHFTEKQFFYLLSRNRSDSGVPGYVRATTNPDARSWVRRFIDWWIGPDGLPIKERAGVIRYFIRVDDKLMWGDSPDELKSIYGAEVLPKSVTFIPAKLEDNKILIKKDPSYKANLEALSRVERMRLKDGNWDVQPSSGLYFKKEWFEIVDAVPASAKAVRYWDRASTAVSDGGSSNPDWTVGLKLLRDDSGIFYVEDIVRFRESPLKVELGVKNTAIRDSIKTTVGLEQDPGQAGVVEIKKYSLLLAGFPIKVLKPITDKITRALGVSAQCEQGNVKVLRGKWNDDFFMELENFPEKGSKDDQVDALSGAFNVHLEGTVGDFTEDMIKIKNNATIAGSIVNRSRW